MSAERMHDLTKSNLPSGQALHRNIEKRRRNGTIYRWLLFSSVVIALSMLGLLIYDVVDEAFGLVALEYRQHPDTLGPVPFEELSGEQLAAIIREEVRPGLVRFLESETPFEEQSAEDLRQIVLEQVAEQRVVASYPLFESVFNRGEVISEIREEHPDAEARFYSWVNWSFLRSTYSSTAELAGIRVAVLGSLWMIGLTILFAFPIGVGAAIYLEEYANQGQWYNRIIQMNINNLAGVPSIIYGLLGLAVFVRALDPVTSGRIFGATNSDNGRTLLAAALTMALLILPLIIINAQEAIRAVPRSLRQASLALGATKWQTIWNHVLPVAFPGILTGNILAMSRAIGETAPLIVIGASAYIVSDPEGPFSKFTVLPVLIYEWTKQPEDTFRDIAAAAIIVLLIMLLSLNSVAVYLRNRFRRSF